ncbi:hypothetical protein [Kaarinaea lacus]
MSLTFNSTNVNDITAAINDACINVVNTYEQVSESYQKAAEVKPDQIATALEQFVDIMQMIEIDYASKLVVNNSREKFTINYHDDGEQDPLSKDEISEIGNYGLELIQNLSEWAGNLDMPEEKHHLHAIMVVVALWVARRGGYLTTIDTVVDTLAAMANACYEPDILVELSDVMGELINAVSQEVKKQDVESEGLQPWRILNINRGIIATRTHDPRIMEPVFEQLVHNIPEDASMFFEQGMQQMEELDYPTNVREVMNRYYRTYSARVLH